METHRIQEWVFKVCFSILFTEFLFGVGATAYYVRSKWHSRPTLDPRALSSIYKGQPWAHTYWQEYERTDRIECRPYVGWGMVPFHGETIAPDQEGFRRTSNSRCGSGTYTV